MVDNTPMFWQLLRVSGSPFFPQQAHCGEQEAVGTRADQRHFPYRIMFCSAICVDFPREL